MDPGAAARVDTGLLSPVSAGADAIVSDDAVVAALVRAEVALAQALQSVGAAPDAAVAGIERAAATLTIDASELAAEAVRDGNPVGAIVGRLRAGVADAETASWVHRGTTSQDILDTALAIVAQRAIGVVLGDLNRTIAALAGLAQRYRDTPAAARTLTQHAVPTTLGARFADWLIQVADARDELARCGLPSQLGGAAGTLAVLVEELGVEIASKVPAAFSQAAGLSWFDAPWHTRRTAITRLGDGLTRVTDALGRIAADVANLSRTEIAELSEGSGGGSTAMPQKRNPVRSVLIRSAALRAPSLAAGLHIAAANAIDERPDGAWHAEWPELRELLRLALGAAAHGALLSEGLTVDEAAVARNLRASNGLIMAERIMLSLGPFLGAPEVQRLIDRAAAGEDLATLLADEPALLGFDVGPILDPSGYIGFTGVLVDRAVARARPAA
ncbi:MAG: adenylosuccinate lyase [Microbacteriaceae bacterium]|nr:adenylosuccinate lyase [Microbacteriaceae bacterium]